MWNVIRFVVLSHVAVATTAGVWSRIATVEVPTSVVDDDWAAMLTDTVRFGLLKPTIVLVLAVAVAVDVVILREGAGVPVVPSSVTVAAPVRTGVVHEVPGKLPLKRSAKSVDPDLKSSPHAGRRSPAAAISAM